MKKKCYAIHYTDTKENIITMSWTECECLIKGKRNMFKGFVTKEEAHDWLASITPNAEHRHNKQVQKAKTLKKEKVSQIQYSFSIDKSLSIDLENKLIRMHLSFDELIDDLIRDYLYSTE